MGSKSYEHKITIYYFLSDLVVVRYCDKDEILNRQITSNRGNACKTKLNGTMNVRCR